MGGERGSQYNRRGYKLPAPGFVKGGNDNIRRGFLYYTSKLKWGVCNSHNPSLDLSLLKYDYKAKSLRDLDVMKVCINKHVVLCQLMQRIIYIFLFYFFMVLLQAPY